MTQEERKHRQRMIDYANSWTYGCPVCGEDLLERTVPLEIKKKIVVCPFCNSKLRIEADAQFEGGMWHDLTRLVPIE
jgi:transcription elongation factor Elf1